MKILQFKAVLAGVLSLLWFTGSVRGQETRISGRMKAADGGNLAGVIMIERGRLYGKDYRFGGRVNRDGTFSILVREGGDYGLHLYATGYIYLPLGVKVESGKDTYFDLTTPPNGAVKDAPSIHNVRFEPGKDNSDQVVIKLDVEDPNDNLSHQVLGTNEVTQEAFIFSPPKWVFPWTKDYPDGTYSLTYETRGRPFDLKEWIFVAADNRCYNSPVLAYPFTEKGIIEAKATGSAGPAKAEDEIKDPRALGRKIYASNCSICHYADKNETKVGPGLLGLFKRDLTPALSLPVTEENIRTQIQRGSERMPPYSHITGKDLDALMAYLKTL